MLGWELPPHNSGGLGVACYHLSKALAQEGAEIDFVLPYTAEHPGTEYMTIHSATALEPIHKFGMLGAYDSKYVEEHDLDKVDVKDLQTMRGVQKRYVQFVERAVKAGKAISCEQPTAVETAEAVRLAKRFGSDDSGRFVNGVLAAVARVVRAGETFPANQGSAD